MSGRVKQVPVSKVPFVGRAESRSEGTEGNEDGGDGQEREEKRSRVTATTGRTGARTQVGSQEPRRKNDRGAG